MVELKIVNIEEKEVYFLKNELEYKMYKFNLTFFDLKNLPQEGDTIHIHKELLDENYIEYSSHYQFGPINQVYGRDVKNPQHTDVITLLINNEKIYLKRFFG